MLIRTAANPPTVTNKNENRIPSHAKGRPKQAITTYAPTDWVLGKHS